MCPSLIEIGSKTAEKNSAQTNRHYENNGHLAVNQYIKQFNKKQSPVPEILHHDHVTLGQSLD